MKATFTLPALLIALSSVAMPTLASNISATVFEDICSDKQTEVRFKINVGQSTDIFFHKARYLQLERQSNAFPTTPIFINALINAGLNKECAELLVRETPSVQQGKSGLIAKVHFSFDKSSLTPTGKKILAGIVDSIKTSSTPISITGHTDSIGSHAYNLTLGLQRAESVKGYLVNAGGDKNRLKTFSAGETKPAQSNKTSAGRTENRRVELVVLPLSDSEKATK
ncbi:OmpA family protein [Grimontia kaedaensis]|uniref:OmpA family protein n=2 Tax=Grimontia kaedaensis TaxID=2872157 RepID=A0ABY4X320_9GAMM|nr:OmpA family protein [Grimontia kaedaensis]